MSSCTYKDAISEAIVFLGGKGFVFEIYDFLEKRHRGLIEGKDQKTWKNTVKYTLCRGNFYQLDNDPGTIIPGSGVCKYWYSGLCEKILTQEEILQQNFEESLKWIHSNKQYQEIMLDYYLEI